MAHTLKVFLDLPLPVDALKFPKVLIVELLTCITSGGVSYLSVALMSMESQIVWKFSWVILGSIVLSFDVIRHPFVKSVSLEEHFPVRLEERKLAVSDELV